jgi:hypothetical protein
VFAVLGRRDVWCWDCFFSGRQRGVSRRIYNTRSKDLSRDSTASSDKVGQKNRLAVKRFKKVIPDA